MGDVTKCDYDVLQGIIKQLQSEEDLVRSNMSDTKNKMEGLRGNTWVGQAADKFFNTMETEVLPKTTKMIYALGVAGHVLTEIIQTIKQADEDTQGFFGDLG